MEAKRKPRVLSGMRPTGPLHLGHLVGALDSWVRLQDDHDCFFAVVDWHALTTDYADTRHVPRFVREVALDWLAVGIDPERSCVFVQSAVKEHAELHLLLSMVIPIPWLERVPSFKEQQEQLSDKDLNTYGFLGYPLLQAADILMYKADLVPVGEDQVPHLELTREVARRFAQFYGPVFPEPQPRLTRAARLQGSDGRKMSKSYGNAIFLGDTAGEVSKKVDGYLTDPQRTHRHVPGDPQVCPVFSMHRVFSTAEQIRWAEAGCRSADIGCRDCKAALKESLGRRMEPIRGKREELAAEPQRIDAILARGAERARDEASRTMTQVRAAMHLQ